MSFEGEIGDIDLVQRLVELEREQFTGAIRFEQDGIIKIVYFKGGDVLSASTNDRVDAVDEILLRAGKITKEHLKQALAKRKENESLGDALLNLGFITRKELTWGRRIQVIGILRSVRAWDHGSYAIVADYLPKREEGTLFPLQQVLIELFVTETDRQQFERALDGGSAVLTKSDGFDEAFQHLGLNEEAAEIASMIDGRRTAAEIAASAGKDIFNTYKLLEALRALGLLYKPQTAETSEPQVKDELEFAAIGVADAEDSWSSGKMPSFESEPEPPVEPTGEEAPPPPGAVATAMAPSEPGWGFDEAQIETAKRATEPVPTPPPVRRPSPTMTQTRRTPPQFTRPPAKKQHGSPAFALVVLLILAGSAFGGWYWWKGQHAAVPAPEPVKRASISKKPVVPTTQTTATTTLASVAPTETSSSPPAPAPIAAAQPKAVRGGRPSAAVPPPQPKVVAQPQPAPSTGAEGAKFTIQVELVCQQASLAKAEQIGGSNIWSVPITYRNQQCHRVFWGRFGSRAEADAAVAQVPSGLRASKPVVVTVPQP